MNSENDKKNIDSVGGMGKVQSMFADLIWQNEPIPSGDLVKLCSRELGWKKSTTYTVLRKLCEKNIFRNENGIVSSLMSRSEYYATQSRSFVNESFGGSLPAFIAAFASGGRLSQKDADEIRAMIDAFESELRDPE